MAICRMLPVLGLGVAYLVLKQDNNICKINNLMESIKAFAVGIFANIEHSPSPGFKFALFALNVLAFGITIALFYKRANRRNSSID
jgi:hypothetical protein